MLKPPVSGHPECPGLTLSRFQRIFACSMVKMHGSSGAWEATWGAPWKLWEFNRSLCVQEKTSPKTSGNLVFFGKLT
jgi:hypothetical protein